MKSSIKIDFIDRGAGIGMEPIIRVELIASDDPRDTLISALFQSLNYGRYLEIRHQYPEGYNPDNQKRILIFKPEKSVEELENLAWSFFRTWLRENKYEESPSEPTDFGVYYHRVGKKNIRIQQSELFKLFLSQSQPEPPIQLLAS